MELTDYLVEVSPAVGAARNACWSPPAAVDADPNARSGERTHSLHARF
jgi:hypothetical protein